MVTLQLLGSPNDKEIFKKNKISWRIKVGIFVPVLLLVITFISLAIKTGGFKSGFYSVTTNGISNSTTDQIESLLKNVYPKSNINLLSNVSKNLETGENENDLTVLITMTNKLSPQERITIATQICDIYGSSNQKLDNLIIWSRLPLILGIFPAESLDKDSSESRTCVDWNSLPSKT